MGDRPHFLRCSKCKIMRYHPMRIETYSGEGLEATGRTKILKSYHGRHNVTLYEIRHKCGHVMWSNHPDAKRLYERR